MQFFFTHKTTHVTVSPSIQPASIGLQSQMPSNTVQAPTHHTPTQGEKFNKKTLQYPFSSKKNKEKEERKEEWKELISYMGNCQCWRQNLLDISSPLIKAVKTSQTFSLERFLYLRTAVNQVQSLYYYPDSGIRLPALHPYHLLSRDSENLGD